MVDVVIAENKDPLSWILDSTRFNFRGTTHNMGCQIISLIDLANQRILLSEPTSIFLPVLKHVVPMPPVFALLGALLCKNKAQEVLRNGTCRWTGVMMIRGEDVMSHHENQLAIWHHKSGVSMAIGGTPKTLDGLQWNTQLKWMMTGGVSPWRRGKPPWHEPLTAPAIKHHSSEVAVRSLPFMSYMEVSENRGTPISSFLMGFSIVNPPFLGTPISGNLHLMASTPNKFLPNAILQSAPQSWFIWLGGPHAATKHTWELGWFLYRASPQTMYSNRHQDLGIAAISNDATGTLEILAAYGTIIAHTSYKPGWTILVYIYNHSLNLKRTETCGHLRMIPCTIPVTSQWGH